MSYVRICVPDSHGNMIDIPARDAFLKDLKRLKPKEVVMLGDHVDVGGLFNAHQPHALKERAYSYAEDCEAANEFLDKIQAAAPNAKIHYLEGNHCQHAERFFTRLDAHQRDRELFTDLLAPQAMLKLKAREIKYYRATEFYNGLSLPGTIKLGRCFFTHGTNCGRFATAAHLTQFSASVVHGHTHRSQSFLTRTVSAGAIGAWSPGTLAQLQPLYMHTSPTGWTHGYGIQFVESNGMFLHLNIPICGGKSLLQPLLKTAG